MSALFSFQRSVFGQARTTAEVFFAGAWRNLDVVPRFHPLIIGPSGTGKSHIARAVAADLGLPLLELSAQNWIPLGCSERGARPTWLDVADFCARDLQGVVFLDEIDKLGERSSWMTHLRVEMFLLLDRKIPGNLQLADEADERQEDGPAAAPELRRKAAETGLRERVFLLGAGAFQELWETKPAVAIGFHAGGSPAPPAVPNHHALARVVPVEIINRFAVPPLVLPPMGLRDYKQLLDELCLRVPPDLAVAVRNAGEESLQSAERQRLGCRWAENLLLETLIARKSKACAPAFPDPPLQDNQP